MALHEKQKSAKIIEEISSFLIERGYKDLSVHLLLGKKQTVFTVLVKKQEEDLIKVFREELYCCREIELEEYGVDHLHNDDCVCTLSTLGLLVDKYDITEENDQYLIHLYRNIL